MDRFLAHLGRQWFMYGIPVVIGTAWLWPDGMRGGGSLHAEAWWQGLIVAIFIASGAGLPAGELKAALGRWRLHLAIQVLSLIAVPLLAWLAKPLFVRFLGPELTVGCLFLACQPTTIAGCIALTRAAGGDVAAALFNAAVGSLLGVFVTPATGLLLTGLELQVPLSQVVTQLGLLVLVPFAAGQGLRLLIGPRVAAMGAWFSRATLVCLLGILWHVFSDSVHQGLPDLPPGALPLLFIAVVGGHIATVALAWQAGAWAWLDLNRPGRVALTVVGTQKTAALGIPMMTVLFAGDPRLGLYTLPILIWHPTQMLVASMLASRMAAWASGPDRGPHGDRGLRGGG